eukprot:TRINITY_DN2819_c0_g2_i1.p1 TRINITY_DN2819_c0_g2~~TRINITY_DN2819_c0_g2_i1.p1  ORF type:complete len:428 (+),score=94.37 TRINITY_DN2819_c0_g2_i1:100-1383(+)
MAVRCVVAHDGSAAAQRALEIGSMPGCFLPRGGELIVLHCFSGLGDRDNGPTASLLSVDGQQGSKRPSNVAMPKPASPAWGSEDAAARGAAVRGVMAQRALQGHAAYSLRLTDLDSDNSVPGGDVHGRAAQAVAGVAEQAAAAWVFAGLANPAEQREAATPSPAPSAEKGRGKVPARGKAPPRVGPVPRQLIATLRSPLVLARPGGPLPRAQDPPIFIWPVAVQAGAVQALLQRLPQLRVGGPRLAASSPPRAAGGAQRPHDPAAVATVLSTLAAAAAGEAAAAVAPPDLTRVLPVAVAAQMARLVAAAGSGGRPCCLIPAVLVEGDTAHLGAGTPHRAAWNRTVEHAVETAVSALVAAPGGTVRAAALAAAQGPLAASVGQLCRSEKAHFAVASAPSRECRGAGAELSVDALLPHLPASAHLLVWR